jgi:hypothetical protein
MGDLFLALETPTADFDYLHRMSFDVTIQVFRSKAEGKRLPHCPHRDEILRNDAHGFSGVMFEVGDWRRKAKRLKSLLFLPRSSHLVPFAYAPVTSDEGNPDASETDGPFPSASQERTDLAITKRWISEVPS